VCKLDFRKTDCISQMDIKGVIGKVTFKRGQRRLTKDELNDMSCNGNLDRHTEWDHWEAQVSSCLVSKFIHTAFSQCIKI